MTHTGERVINVQAWYQPTKPVPSSMPPRAPVLPPLDITLPETIAFHEKHNPNLPVYVFSKDGTEGITEVSYAQFAKASRRVPQLLGIQFDLETKPVVAMLALTDTLLYHTILLGMMRIGIVVSVHLLLMH